MVVKSVEDTNTSFGAIHFLESRVIHTYFEAKFVILHKYFVKKYLDDGKNDIDNKNK